MISVEEDSTEKKKGLKYTFKLEVLLIYNASQGLAELIW